MMELLTSPEAWVALLTLTALEIVLGIDNVIFISVIVSRIPPAQAKRARQIGLLLALIVLANDFNVGLPIIVALCAIAAYVVGSHAAIRLIKSFKA